MNTMYKNILLVEDERMIAEMYADILRQEGFTVTIKPDGLTGLEAAQTGEYDLVLLDLMLPIITGIEVLDRLRNPDESPKFTTDHHVVVLTNLTEDDILTKAIESKAEGFYTKVNITPLKLASIIKEMGQPAQVPAAA